MGMAPRSSDIGEAAMPSTAMTSENSKPIGRMNDTFPLAFILYVRKNTLLK